MSELRALTRAALAAALRETVSVRRDEAIQQVDNILKHMCRVMSRGEQVTIIHFGTFRVLQKGARPGRNPNSGQEVTIAPHKVLTFRGCEEFRERLLEQAKP